MKQDPLDTARRSEQMARVSGTGNRSTELAVESVLRASGIDGWTKHPRDIPGRPDFYFPEQRVALFVDGCFWHACPRCARNVPTNRRDFWQAKIDQNRRRDNRVRRQLRSQGFRVVRVWEHEVRSERWLPRLMRMLEATS